MSREFVIGLQLVDVGIRYAEKQETDAERQICHCREKRRAGRVGRVIFAVVVLVLVIFASASAVRLVLRGGRGTSATAEWAAHCAKFERNL
jgi:xanthine/uracil permease